MDSLWNTYFNASLVLLIRSCQKTFNFKQDDDVDDDLPGRSNDIIEESDAISDLSEAFSWLFRSSGNSEGEEYCNGGTVCGNTDTCQDIVNTSLNSSASAQTLLLSCFVIIVSLCACVLYWTLASRGKSKVAQLPAEENRAVACDESSKEKENQRKVSVEKALKNGESESGPEPPAACFATVRHNSVAVASAQSIPVVIPLSVVHGLSQDSPLFSSSSSSSASDGSQFLTSTMEHLHNQLDWLLGVASADQFSPSSDLSPAASSLVTPRMPRKGSIRRPRWRTLNSLPLGADGATADDKSGVRLWQRVNETAKKMKWTHLDVGDLDISAVKDSRLSASLQFYQQTCPIPTQQWAAASLIVNYTLTLVQQELAGCAGSNKSILQFVDLCSFGSASSNTCISRADRFDLLMVVQPSTCSELTVFHSGVCDDIPVGKLAIGGKEASSTSATISTTTRLSPALFQKDRVGENFGLFLSQKEVVKASQKILSTAMEKLKLKHRSLLDRLPFSMQLDQYNELRLMLDTRMLNALGLGLSKITINFNPAVKVTPPEHDPLPTLYAVPPWKSSAYSEQRPDSVRNRIHSRIMRNQNQGIASDLLWQLEGSDLTRSFMASAQRKISSAGFFGCQEMCQQILRALFSHSAKDVLLTLGEIDPYVLDSVVCFLLLESPPASWSLDSLPDRLSDCVHFLRSAVQSAWMPGFLVHNPHLLKRMPALQLLPLLSTGRQENILSNVSPESAETMLTFIEARLQETGLRRCLKDEYSSEMWEYEFFIFG